MIGAGFVMAAEREAASWTIRDSLTLNVLMLAPVEAIREWQAGG